VWITAYSLTLHPKQRQALLNDEYHVLASVASMVTQAKTCAEDGC
jgi:hypothetical protein